MTTTNATHTPGPWQSMHAGNANDEHARTIRSYGGAWIADVLRQGTEADRAANARLIAAAPDLLAALQHVFDAAEDGGDMNDIDWDMLRAAIARAEGGGK